MGKVTVNPITRLYLLLADLYEQRATEIVQQTHSGLVVKINHERMMETEAVEGDEPDGVAK